MADASSHGPGRDIKGEGGSVRQRFSMGEGNGPMGGDFGVAKLSSVNGSGKGGSGTGGGIPAFSEVNGAGRNHGMGRDDGGMDRSGRDSIPTGKGRMNATAHSDHGMHDAD